ncbi:MAG: flagellar hook-associated protein FlgK [Deltaproteobacteria bacterium]|nr:flagellar hook-associated protein FlgK [Deltaproteobacteria bacterium]
MSGITLLLNTAKGALMAQQFAMDVVSHNVANVNTPDYTRQEAVLQAMRPAPYEGMTIGRGVDVTSVKRNADAFIENWLQQRQSDLSATSEQEVYMKVLEGVFNENSGRSLTGQMTDFWNAWNDVANNPSGDAERNALFERGALLCQAFRDISTDLDQVHGELNLSLGAGVESVNEITGKIAGLNEQIVAMSATGDANDLLDQRQHLVNQLSEYLDISYYVNSDNTMTVTTRKGNVLVSKAESYSLSFDGNSVLWESSGGVNVDITATIAGGKMGGWLEMRDVILPEYNDKLNLLSSSLLWEVNNIHAQGVGLETMTDVTGSFGATNPGAALQSSGLDFQDRITNGSFNFWVYDPAGNVVNLGGPGGSLQVAVDPTTTTMNGLQSTLNGIAAGNITANITVDGKLEIHGAAGYSFAFSNDTSGVLSALGVNTFFSGGNAANMSMNSALAANKNLIAAGRVGAAGEMATGDNSNALDMAGLQYRDASGLNDTLDNYLASLEGSIGIKSQSITRTKEYNDVIVSKLKETRNNISAVSLDEEMTDLIRFQHAYAAAAKLISTADEMYQTLLQVK